MEEPSGSRTPKVSAMHPSTTPVRPRLWTHPRRRAGIRSLLATVLAAVVVTGSVSAPVAAAGTAPVTAPRATSLADPGPAGDFAWKGFNWEKRWWAGAPHYNQQFDPANVGSPDANGYVTLKLSNPTGQAAIGAEFNTTRRGFGYGTYSTTVEKDLTTLQKEVVWGCLFTYDPAAAPGFNEVDLCEASSWGGGSNYNQVWPITQGHGYWIDASKGPGIGNDTAVFGVTNHPILTHRLVWEPNKLTFETFAGEGYSGTLLKRTVLQGENVPEPARESIHFNLWVTDGGGGDPAHVKPEKVVVRDFSFVPAAATPTPTPAITLSATSTKARSITSTTLGWTGASGSTVTLLTDGVRRTIPNSGRYSTTAKKPSVRYQVCDATRCSAVVTAGR